MLTELKPCPFCGSKDIGAGPGWVHCHSCRVTLKIRSVGRQHETAEAIDAWNRRAIKAEVLQAQEPQNVCGAQALGGLCCLPAGHNRGNLDIPSNHQAAPQPPAPCQCADPEQIIALRHAADTAEAQARENVELCAKVAYYEAQMCLPDNPLIAIPSGYTAQVAARSVSPERVADVITQRDALRAEVERLTTICADKDWYGIDALQAKVADQAAKEFDWAKANAKCTDTIAQQAERIAELEEENIKRLETSCQQHAKIMSQAALIEKCDHTIASIKEINPPLPMGMSEEIEETIIAIAAQKGGSY